MITLTRVGDWLLPSGRAKLSFNVVPHAGILPIWLGASREEVAAKMREFGHKRSYKLDQIDRYIDGAVGVEFDSDDHVSSVELHPHRTLTANFFGIEPAEEVFDLIARSGDEDVGRFGPTEHMFRKQIVTLWRADPQHDLGGARFPVWGSIGAGNQIYLRHVDQLIPPP